MNIRHRPQVLFLVVGFVLVLVNSHADGATGIWLSNPGSNDWNTGSNWSSGAVPNGSHDLAYFDSSNVTNIEISDYTWINKIIFDPGASQYTITVGTNTNGGFEIWGNGIDNNSGLSQNFAGSSDAAGNNGGFIFVEGEGSVGPMITFTLPGAMVAGGGAGYAQFQFGWSAGEGTYENLGGTASGAIGGAILFIYPHSTAGNATINNYAGTVSGALGATTSFFFNKPNAGIATINCYGATVDGAGGGEVSFSDEATGGSATLIAYGGSNSGGGGQIKFSSNSQAESAHIQIFGNGTLDITGHSSRSLSIGSVEGDGQIVLGSSQLIIGENNLDTTFSGVIQGEGSVSKSGTGTLSLSNSNTYSGGTAIEGGKLIVNNQSGSGTGTGPLQVNGGQLGGLGIIAGAVTVGTGAGPGAFLTPGKLGGKPGALTIEDSLIFNADGIYKCGLNSRSATADKVVANGVTINGGRFVMRDPRGLRLPSGTVLTVIDNTSANLISGTFSNLPDGSTLTVGSNNYEVSYSGGDGNDLTLTVVP